MAAIETISGFATAPGASPGATIGVTGSSGFSGGTTGTIRNFTTGRAFALDMNKNGQAAAGSIQVLSPKMHDAVQGIRFQCNFGATRGVYPWGFPQQHYSQDTLTFKEIGSAVGGDIENFLYTIYYENPQSSQAQLAGLDDIEAGLSVTGNLWAVTFALVGATSGQFGAQQALSAGTADLSHANTNYALLGLSGFTESAANNGCAVGVLGPGTGNYRVSMPLLQGQDYNASEYFLQLSRFYKAKLCPVINAADKGGTLFDVLNNENANTVTVSIVFAQLSA
jgi:hypothetical protein